MDIRTQHIQHKLAEAAEMAIHADRHKGELIEWRGNNYTVDQFLSRAANLASHSAEELRDEAFQSVGFPLP